MIRYKKYQVTGEDSPLKGLWYARPVIEETFDIEKLAKHMSNHNTPYSSVNTQFRAYPFYKAPEWMPHKKLLLNSIDF